MLDSCVAHPITSQSALFAALGKDPRSILGREESRWLYFKSGIYDLTASQGKLELAKDVASLANADGGVILMGVATQPDPTSLRQAAYELEPIPDGMVGQGQIQAVINEYAVPRIEVDITSHEVRGMTGRLWAIAVRRSDVTVFLSGTEAINIGDKKRFGIEFDLDATKLNDPELSEWLFGRVRWWANGQAIGFYEDNTIVMDVAVEAERVLTYEGRRRDEECFALSTEALYRQVTYALHDDHGQSDEQVRADEERYRRLVVKPAVDVFDAWAIFLIEGETHARLVWRRHDEPELHEAILRPGEVDEVLKQFLVALQASRCQ